MSWNCYKSLYCYLHWCKWHLQINSVSVMNPRECVEEWTCFICFYRFLKQLNKTSIRSVLFLRQLVSMVLKSTYISYSTYYFKAVCLHFFFIARIIRIETVTNFLLLFQLSDILSMIVEIWSWFKKQKLMFNTFILSI